MAAPLHINYAIAVQSVAIEMGRTFSLTSLTGLTK